MRSTPGAAPPEQAATVWQRDAAQWRLVLSGDWRGRRAAALPAAPPAAAAPGPVPVCVEAQALTHWDDGLAAALWARLAPLQRAGHPIQLDSLPPQVRGVLGLALNRVTTEAIPAPPARPSDDEDGPSTGGAAPRAKTLAWMRRSLHDARETATFFGEVLLALGRLLRGRSQLRRVDLWRELDIAGPLSLPIVGLTCFLVGLMLAYMGGAQLDRIGAQSYIANVVTVGMVRELAGLMTGVILSGRLGAAYAAELGSMQANEEIDALRVLGIDPIDHLVLPRLLALMMVGPLLIAIAALVGVLAGLPAAVGVYGVPSADYLHKSLTSLTWTHLWIGLFKGELYVALVAIAGCMEGLNAGRNAAAVGTATTRAVVKALVWIVATACGTTMVFQSLGF